MMASQKMRADVRVAVGPGAGSQERHRAGWETLMRCLLHSRISSAPGVAVHVVPGAQHHEYLLLTTTCKPSSICVLCVLGCASSALTS
jgi:hypothetical protein